jgi:hypothetical protein
MVLNIETAKIILSNPKAYPSDIVVRALKMISDRSLGPML